MPTTLTMNESQKTRSVLVLDELETLGVTAPKMKSGEILLTVTDGVITTAKLSSQYDPLSAAAPTGNTKNNQGVDWTP